MWKRVRLFKQKEQAFKHKETKELRRLPPNFPKKEKVKEGKLFVILEDINKKDI